MRLPIEKRARVLRALDRGTTLGPKGQVDRHIIKEHTQGSVEHRYHATKGWRTRRLTTGDLAWAMNLPRV